MKFKKVTYQMVICHQSDCGIKEKGAGAWSRTAQALSISWLKDEGALAQLSFKGDEQKVHPL